MPRLPDPFPSPTNGVPAPLLTAAGLVVLEGLLSIGFAVSEAVHTHTDRLVLGVTTTLFFALYGGALMVCAWGMRSLRPWSRSPVILTQLIFLGLAWNLRSGSTLPLAIGAAVVAVLVLLGVFHPRSIDALDREEHKHHDGDDDGSNRR